MINSNLHILEIFVFVFFYLIIGIIGALLVGDIWRTSRKSKEELDNYLLDDDIEVDLSLNQPGDPKLLKVLQAISVLLGPVVPGVIILFIFGFYIFSVVEWIIKMIKKTK